ncbi:MAG: AMP phosphorylase [Candidatus Woesearchaeota archaeon]
MKLKIKRLPIKTGGILVVLLHESDAKLASLEQGDRITLNPSDLRVVVDTTNSLVEKGEIGVFSDIKGLRSGSYVTVKPTPKPKSVSYIKKKLRGERLSYEEMFEIVHDIVTGDLTDIEITYFVSANYIHELNYEETASLTRAMIDTGDSLSFDGVVADKHCIGGVAGNRTTVFVVPILAAAGVKTPKTSSRSITSPAGTADTMEVMCNVSLSKDKIVDVVNKHGGCLVWGGAIDLAPADDKIIRVEHPVSLDPTGQLLASILAKKKSAGATHCLIDIPYGQGAKIVRKHDALDLKHKFETLGKMIDLKLKVVLTDGTEPIGNGIGPALEARDILYTLKNDPRGSKQLLEKGIILAGELLELTGTARRGKGHILAQELIDSGKAYAKFVEIIKAQGAKIDDPDKIKVGAFSKQILSPYTGKVTHVDNRRISLIAKQAGAPNDKGAGLFLEVHKKSRVRKGDVLYMIFSNSQANLGTAVERAMEDSGIIVK